MNQKNQMTKTDLEKVQGGIGHIAAGVIACAIWWCIEPKPIERPTLKAFGGHHLFN